MRDNVTLLLTLFLTFFFLSCITDRSYISATYFSMCSLQRDTLFFKEFNLKVGVRTLHKFLRCLKQVLIVNFTDINRESISICSSLG